MNAQPQQQPANAASRVTILLDELEAALTRESFWLTRGELTPLMEALPAKNDLIKSLETLKGSAALEGDAKLKTRLRDLGLRQEDHARRLDGKLAEMRRELESLTVASRKLQRFEAGGERRAGGQALGWA